MTNKMWSIHTKMRTHLWTKYCLSNNAYSPFNGLKAELEFVPEKYRALYLRTQRVEDPLHDLMVFVSECEAMHH
jgi:hypothetical protein